MSTALESLIDMGFPKNRAEKALAKTNHQGAAAAMDWLFAHSDDPDIDDPYEAPKGHRLTDEPAASDGATGAGEAASAASLKCDECGKQLRDADAAQAHAVRTGHSQFSESTDQIRPLTEEEKKAQLEKIRQRMAERKQLKELEEKQEQVDREKVRRRTGREISDARQKHEMQEAKKLADMKRREKLEEKQAKEAIRAKIAQDKAERAARAKAASSAPTSQPAPTGASSSAGAPAASNPVAKKEYTSCRMQIRLSNGTALTASFAPADTFSVVVDYVTANRTDGAGPFSLMTTFPRKVFGSESLEKSLQELGLVPSAVLVLTKG